MKTITVEDKVWKMLTKLKLDLGEKNISSVIIILFKSKNKSK